MMKNSTTIFRPFVLVMYVLFAVISVRAQVHESFDVRYENRIRGNMTMISNNILNRDGGTWATRPNVPYNYDGNSQYNDNFDMRYIDIDNDDSTFSSSSASLSIADSEGCYKIVYAGLYWSGTYPFNSKTDNSRGDIRQVKLKLPGQSTYNDINGEIIYDGLGSSSNAPYACYADITNYITALDNAEGEYTIANVRASQGSYNGSGSNNFTGGSSAGWTIFLVYEDLGLPARFITSFDGFATITRDGVSSVDVPVSGFRTNPTGPVYANLMTVALEGDWAINNARFWLDAGSNGSFQLMGDNINPTNNFFNSKISIDDVEFTDRVPNSSNTLGYDATIIDITNILANDETQATMRFDTTQDAYYPFFSAFSAEVVMPDIRLVKHIRDAQGNDISNQEVELGGTIIYRIEFQNIGNDDARDFTIRDVLPLNARANVQISGSNGVTWNHDEGAGEIVFTVPDNLVEAGDPRGWVEIQVSVATDCENFTAACSHIIRNQAFGTYTGAESGQVITDDPSLSGIDDCYLGEQVPVNILANTASCIFEREEVLCAGQLTLTAGGGFESYTWTNSAGTVIGTTQSITVNTPGVYSVFKETGDGSTCPDLNEVVNVVLHGDLQDNPLLPEADVVETCTDDGSSLPKFFLCGANDRRLINTGIVDAAVRWEKLRENNSCGAAGRDAVCANRNSACTWDEVATGSQYEIGEHGSGQYRMVVSYQGGCFSRFYFNVYTNDLDPTATREHIICGNNGNITIDNVPAGYEYRWLRDGVEIVPPTINNNSIDVDTPGIYEVEIRQVDVQGGCVFRLDNIVIQQRDMQVGVTTQPVTDCDDGTIDITVEEVGPQYYFRITNQTGSAVIAENGPTTNNRFTYEGIPNSGMYNVLVTAEDGSCSVTLDSIYVARVDSLNITANVQQHITCGDTAKIQVHSSGGRTPHRYAIYRINGANQNPVYPGDYQGSQTFDVSAGGTYTFVVTDVDGCQAYSQPVTVENYPPLDYEVTSQDVTCFGADDGRISVSYTPANGFTLIYTLQDSDGNDITGTHQAGNNFENLPPGDYTLTVSQTRGNNECDGDVHDITITGPDSALTADSEISGSGVCDPEVGGQTRVVNAQGGTPPYEYSFDGGTSYDDQDTRFLPPGTHNIYVRDARGCVFILPPLDIPDPLTRPTVIADITEYDCEGNSEIIVSLQNHDPGYHYWYAIDGIPNDPDPTSNIFTGVSPGNHTITVNYSSQDPPGEGECPGSVDIPITVETGRAFNARVTSVGDVSCADDAVTTITFVVENFDTATGYDYSVDGGLNWINSTTSPISVVAPVDTDTEEVTLMVRYAQDECEVSITRSVTVPEAITVTAGISEEATCTTGASVTAQASGGVPPYRFNIDGGAWSEEGTSHTFNDLATGTYTITARDRNSCEQEITIDVEAPVALEFTATPTNCYLGDNNGQIIVDVDSGNGGYRFRINGGVWEQPNPPTATSYYFTQLPSGTYIIEVMDASGCAGTPQTVVINQEFAAVVSTTDINCEAGTITAEASGGDGNYVYAFVPAGAPVNPGDFSASPTFNVPPGSEGDYDVHIRDNNGDDGYCEYIDTVTIEQAPALQVSVTAQDPQCYGETGSVSVEINSGQGLYSIALIDGSGTAIEELTNFAGTTRTFSNLEGGTYTVRVTDRFGCEEEDTVSVTIPDELTADLEAILPADCDNPDPDQHGVRFTDYPTYPGLTVEFSIDNGINWQTSPEFTGHPSGTVLYPSMRTVDGDLNPVCRVDFDEPFTVPYPPVSLVIDAEAEAVGCDFQVTVRGSDGVPPYTFAVIEGTGTPGAGDWVAPNTPPDTHVFTGLVPGRTYAFYVQDGTGCVRMNDVDIYDEYDIIDTEVTFQRTPACFGEDNGEIIFTVNDGDGIHENQVRWELRDSNDGLVQDSGGAIAYAPPMDINVTGLALGEYYLVVTEVNAGGDDACHGASRNVRIDQARPITHSGLDTESISCNIPGHVRINGITGGWGGYTYTLSGDNLSEDIVTTENPIQVPYGLVIDPTLPVLVNVSVVDQYGCSADFGSTVLGVSELPEIESITTNNCRVPFSIEVVASGGSGVYNYSLDGGASFVSNGGVFNNVVPGTYEIVVRDSNGCETDPETVEIYPLFEAGVQLTKPLDCTVSSPDAQITITASGGSGNYQYEVTGDATIPRAPLSSNPHTFSVAGTGEYIVTVYDERTGNPVWNASECAVTDTIRVEEPVRPDFSVTTTDISCNNAADGVIRMIAVDNGINPLTYTLAPMPAGVELMPDGNGFQNLPPGNYTVTATGTNECTTSISDIIIQHPAAITIPPAAVTVTEFGCTSGNTPGEASIQLDASQITGGSGTYVTYEFVDNATGDIVQSGTSAELVWTDHNGGSFTINVSDSEGCLGSTTATIQPFDNILEARITTTDATCEVGAVASLRVITSTGNTNRIRWSLDNGDGDPDTNNWQPYGTTIDDLEPGTYVFFVRHIDTGCILPVSHTVTAPESFGITAEVLNNVICPGSESGRVTFEMTGTSYSGIFEWEVFHAADDTPTGHSGNHNAAGGPTPPVSLGGGNYYVQIRQADAPNCTRTQTFNIAEPIGGDIRDETEVTVIPITCQRATGTIYISASGGWGGHTYYVAPITAPAPAAGDYTDIREYTGLTPDVYQVWVRDAGGCAVQLDNVNLQQPDPIDADIVASPGTQLDCIGDMEVQLSAINVTGGSGNYMYRINIYAENGIDIISTSDTYPNASFDDYGAGIYSITVEDDWGCSFTTATIAITEPATITATLEIESGLKCEEDAVIRVSASGGAGAPYTYSADINGPYLPADTFTVGPGTYRYYVKDANDCDPVRTNEVTINELEDIDITLDLTAANINCSGEATATIRASAAGGLGNYLYTLLDENQDPIAGQQNTSGQFTQLPEGTYYVHVESDDCVETSVAVTITEPDPLDVDVDVLHVVCPGGRNGRITLNTTGGTGTIKYAISPNLNQFDEENVFDNLPAGIYTIVVQDGAGCFETLEVEIEEPAPIEITLSYTEELCVGDDEAVITAVITGGSGTYFTSLNNRNNFVEGKLEYDGLAGGQDYVLFVRDSNGCEANAIISIPAGVDIAPDVEITYGNCLNSSFENEVTVTIADPGEVTRVTYSLDGGPPRTGRTFTNLTPGNHTIEVIHTNGCIKEVSFVIEEREPLSSVVATSVSHVDCYGGQSGTITVQSTGGVGAVEYALLGIDEYQSANVFHNLEAGTYTVIARDEAGCTVTTNVTIDQPSQPVNIQIQSIQEEVCEGDSDASVEISISGGTPPYATSLNSRNNYVNDRFLFTGLDGGRTHTIYIRDANGCEYEENIRFASPVSIGARVDIDYGCTGSHSTNTVTVRVNDEVAGDVMYRLDGGAGQIENTFTNLQPGLHSVEVIHANGCARSVSFTIDDIRPLQLTLRVDRLNQITAIASGGAGGYRYYVDGEYIGDRNTYEINHTASYTVTVTDANGCEATATVNMEFVDIEIPNVFTPNEDGFDDTWRIRNSEGFPNMIVIIYDRYGRELAKLPQGVDWDGRYKGKPLPTGDYWYTIKLHGENDNREFVGHFTLYR